MEITLYFAEFDANDEKGIWGVRVDTTFDPPMELAEPIEVFHLTDDNAVLYRAMETGLSAAGLWWADR